jgi:Protein phosphatase 2C
LRPSAATTATAASQPRVRWSFHQSGGAWWITGIREGTQSGAAAVSGKREDGVAPDLSREIGEFLSRDDATKAEPPTIAPPEGLCEVERSWVKETPRSEARAGCFSHRGPPWIWQDKENEDFAFALDRVDAAGQVWVVAGVCDGVTQSPWSERGARHAAAAFIDAMTRHIASSTTLESDLQQTESKHEFARAFHDILHRRLEEDGRALQQGRFVDPKFGERHFRRVFLDGPDAGKREEWFQTTLLGCAVGPRGGVALLMGDGYLRVDRELRDGTVKRKNVPLQGDPSKPERFASTQLTRDDVVAGIRGVLPDGAAAIQMVLATDGVAKSPDHGLDEVELQASSDCRRFLEALAGRSDHARVESDNMSVAFVRRQVRAAGDSR